MHIRLHQQSCWTYPRKCPSAIAHSCQVQARHDLHLCAGTIAGHTWVSDAGGAMQKLMCWIQHITVVLLQIKVC